MTAEETRRDASEIESAEVFYLSLCEPKGEYENLDDRRVAMIEQRDAAIRRQARREALEEAALLVEQRQSIHLGQHSLTAVAIRALALKERALASADQPERSE